MLTCYLLNTSFKVSIRIGLHFYNFLVKHLHAIADDIKVERDSHVTIIKLILHLLKDSLRNQFMPIDSFNLDACHITFNDLFMEIDDLSYNFRGLTFTIAKN